MNTYAEYQFAQKICKAAICDNLFFENLTLRTEDAIDFKIFHSTEKKKIFIGLINYFIIMEKKC